MPAGLCGCSLPFNTSVARYSRKRKEPRIHLNNNCTMNSATPPSPPPLLLLLLLLLCNSNAAAASAAGVVTILHNDPSPVIDRATAARFGVHGGFETGNAVQVGAEFHLFVGERAPPTTYPWKMGWTTQLGHWMSTNDGAAWTRVETVLPFGAWSAMPYYDSTPSAAAGRWKILYCNESDATTRTAVAANPGMGSVSHAQAWSFSTYNPSPKTYSISNPWKANGSWNVFLDHGQFNRPTEPLVVGRWFYFTSYHT